MVSDQGVFQYIENEVDYIIDGESDIKKIVSEIINRYRGDDVS